VVISLKNLVPDKIIPFISAALFGIIHYWGTPGGVYRDKRRLLGMADSFFQQ
jgi:hypothetical protein